MKLGRDSVVLELRQEVEQREERLQQLEDLVLKLDKERRRLQEEADRDALDAKDLMEEVMKLSNGDTQARDQAGTHEVHGRLATASVQLRLARLDLATVKAKGAAFADCVPRTWQETTEAPSSASQSLSAALAIGACARAAERLLFRLEALGRHAAASGQRGAKLRMEMCEVACVAFRCAAAVASVLDAGLVGENTSIEATKKLEAQFKRVEQKTKELMHKKWPLDSPSQALNCLQEVETLTSEVLKGGLSVRGLCYQFQRFQVAFAYGVASKRATKHAVEAPPSEAAKPVQEEKVEEDGAMAALMRLQNRKKTPEEAPPEGPVEAPVAPAPVEQPQVELQPEDFQEDLWPEMELRLQVAQQTGGQHRAAESELQRLGKGIEVGLGKCATGEEEEPISFWRALKAASDYCQALLPPSETRIDLLSKNAEESLSRSSARLASEPPAWAASSLEVQSRVEEIDEKHREVQEAQEQLKEKKKLLSFSEEEMLKAEDRGKKLKAKLSAMIEAQQTSDALQAEEEQLRRDVAAKAQRQAQLVQQIEETKAKRDKLEQLYKDEEKKRKHLEESIDKMRQRPKQDEDGRATAPEFAALRLSQQKGARELYALQVSGMNDLVPLPESKEVSSAEECVQKYTTLRKSLLRHLSSARVQRLGVRNPEEEVFASRLQELHFQLSEARSSLNALGPLSPQAKTLEAKPGGEAAEALTMAFTLQPPRWAHMKVPKELYSSSWSDIREIHVAAA
ncbi:unnamed protein product [Cladocopium goreaui]|uniref:AP2/ERF domain-containing protein n=1 Tax=Cladocopium goreaui TaxID=2562237 RepID=A0A9P1CHJ5_9DINO|nr:unnamed protein product [Cladocopium goreaui]